MKKSSRIILSAAFMMLGCTLYAQQEIPAYRNTELSAEKRADDLISRLTLEEKAALMQNESVEITRLGIKAYDWWNEALHGVGRNGSATVFPQPIGMAASFDDKLLHEVFTSVSDEARVKHRIAAAGGNGVKIYQGVTFWTPNINIFRDPRWGRGMETYGEDPYLTGVMGMAVVRGLQGEPGSSIRKAHACAKHYAVHSGPEWSRHSYDARISERDLRETYLPAFKDLVTKADVQEVMTAYNRFNGEPCAASGRLVKEILRGEWGYKGMIVSDCWAIDDFYVSGRHNFVESAAAAAAAAVKTGVDVECGPNYRFIPDAVAQGLLTEQEVDICLRRALIQRFELGEMDGKSLWNDLDDDIVEGEAHRELSKRMADETIVLLQNRGKILPLEKGSRIAVMGPNADDAEMMWGNYNAIPNSTVTMLQAMKEADPQTIFVKGCDIVQPGYDLKAILKSLEGIETVVFAGGISPRLEGEEMPVSVPGFRGGDRTDLELPAVQRELLKDLHGAGKKIVLVNFSGSAVALVPETESCDAILQAWYPGQEGGKAIADILYGEVNPSAKLPVTFYKSVEQLPDFENYDMEGHTYRYFRSEPLYPFGYGLSYTNFSYGKPKVKNGVLSFKVKNTGKVDGVEVVQLYISRPDDEKGPIKTLRGFKRVFVPAGKSVEVAFLLNDETFQWWNGKEQNITPLPGTYTLQYGGDSENCKVVNYEYRKQ